MMRHIFLSDGSVLFRQLPPAGFVFKNYAPVPGNPYQYKPVYAFECEYRIVKERRSPCGQHLLGHDTTCSLDQKGTSFSQCNACNPVAKKEALIQIEVKLPSDFVPNLMAATQHSLLNLAKDHSEKTVRQMAKEVRDATKRSVKVDPTQHLQLGQESGCEVGKSQSVLGKEPTDFL